MDSRCWLELRKPRTDRADPRFARQKRLRNQGTFRAARLPWATRRLQISTCIVNPPDTNNGGFGPSYLKFIEKMLGYAGFYWHARA
jgi:hypothetical protein